MTPLRRLGDRVDTTPDRIRDDLHGIFRGELRWDPLTRHLYSRDASPFQIHPLAVATPRDADDLSQLMAYAHDNGLPVIPRGAGTGLAGESLGPGIIVDLSVHFRRILEVSPESVRVEAGVTLGEVNQALAPLGQRLAPDPASAASCTIGGMIATNASGGTAFRHGYTREYVQELHVCWDTGERDRITARAHPEDSPGLTARRQAVVDLLEEHRPVWEAHTLQTRYNRCGYALAEAMTPSGFDLTRLLVGSEGTLAWTVDACLRTIPLAGGTCRAVLGFLGLQEALEASRMLETCPGIAGCDLLDQRLLSLTRVNHGGTILGLVPPSIAVVLIPVFEGASEREALRDARAAIERVIRQQSCGVLVEPSPDPDAEARILAFRDVAVNGLYALSRGARPEACVEDVAVPTPVLMEYVSGVRALLREHDFTASFLIHTLTGQVHCRPFVNLEQPDERARLWPLAERIHRLAISLGGTISTQHGTGIARTPWVEAQSGPLMPLYRQIKRIFDPTGILNPGKIIGPDPRRPAWPLREVTDPTEGEGRAVPLLVWGDNTPAAEASSCNGCGDCRGRSQAARMCPIFRSHGGEDASPRAMANMLPYVLNAPERWTDDDVRAIADHCVNCKMCKLECKANIDIPRLMLEVKGSHHQARGLDRADWFFARIESLAALAGNFSFTTNAMLGRRASRWVVEKLFGVSRTRTLPRFTHRTFLRRARRLNLTQVQRGHSPSGRKLAYFVDTFANYNDPLIGEATVAVLQHHGFEVHVPRYQRGSGMAAVSYGDLDTAREYARHNVRILADLVREGYQIICSEPTAALALTQEYATLLNDPDVSLVAENTFELMAFLEDVHLRQGIPGSLRDLPIGLGHHVPCHAKALGRPPAAPRILQRIPGLRVHTIDVSCSGMAGTWGLKARNHAASLRAGQPMLDELARPRVLYGSTECGSCRMQMQDGSGKRTLHPIQYLALAYGLLPELERKLLQPLRPLLSD